MTRFQDGPNSRSQTARGQVGSAQRPRLGEKKKKLGGDLLIVKNKALVKASNLPRLKEKGNGTQKDKKGKGGQASTRRTCSKKSDRGHRSKKKKETNDQQGWSRRGTVTPALHRNWREQGLRKEQTMKRDGKSHPA